MLSINDRLYWFSRNLLGYVLFWLSIAPFTIWITILAIVKTTATATVTDGSEIISFPWEWKWWDI